MNNYVIYTDGAYSPMRDQGGIGIIVLKGESKILEYSKPFLNTTNNQMELIAVITALRAIKNKIDKVTIITDSQYVIGCATKGWKRKKNKNLWSQFDSALEKAKTLCDDVSFEWTKGHEDDKYNNECDKLAVKATQLYLK